jgi:hypothetical protein
MGFSRYLFWTLVVKAQGVFKCVEIRHWTSIDMDVLVFSMIIE